MSRSHTRTRTEIKEIRQHLDRLKQQPWLLPSQRWWPDFLFHCTDVRNVVNILRTGEMLSRTQALASQQLHVDIASRDIIAQTSETWQDYVRLYFRPKTPTQYRNEGFRPVGQRYHQTQCPVPVYLIIDAMEVLAKTGVLFTDGNVAAGAEPTGDVGFFTTIPFEAVYHSGWYDTSIPNRIVYHRNAEVLAPERLGATAIRFICCRSQAEYDTLLDLLPPGPFSHWVDKIGVRPQLNLFYKEWCFVEQVEMNRESVLFRFNTGDSRNPSGPFNARAEIIETLTGGRFVWSNDDFVVSSTLPLSLLNLRHPEDYSLRFLLDDQLAYSGRYQEEPLPF